MGKLGFKDVLGAWRFGFPSLALVSWRVRSL